MMHLRNNRLPIGAPPASGKIIGIWSKPQLNHRKFVF
jgi:hypothetical protein